MGLKIMFLVGLNEDTSVQKIIASKGQCIPSSLFLTRACLLEPKPDANGFMAFNEIFGDLQWNSAPRSLFRLARYFIYFAFSPKYRKYNNQCVIIAIAQHIVLFSIFFLSYRLSFFFFFLFRWKKMALNDRNIIL